MLKKIIGFLFLSSLAFPSLGSHIVGNDFTYECIGNNTYRFTLSLYRDCRPESLGGGRANSIAFDNPAFITVFDGTGNLISSNDQYTAISDEVIPLEINNSCIDNMPVKCLNRLRFSFTKTLAPNTTGYYLTYQRCCRNTSTVNVNTNNGVGVSMFCFVPPSNIYGCNSSAVFDFDPPQVICMNSPLRVNVSASDLDNDSLSYELCSAVSGASRTANKPNTASAPPYTPVAYNTPYSATAPMAANPQISVDPVSGILTGTPTLQGIFDIAVCCLEWRNGILINTTRREFQMEVTNCSRNVIADIPVLSAEANTYIIKCDDLEVNFTNTSSGGYEYHWDFGETNTNADTSNLYQPSHTYSDTGTYLVKLVVNQSSDCADSISRWVKVYPTLTAELSYSGLLCPDIPINFQDMSASTNFPINSWRWNFDDGTSSTLQNPSNTFSNIGKNYQVQLVAGNTAGCLDTALLQLNIPKLDFFVGNDTVILKNSSLNFNGRGAQTYTWDPPTFLDNAFINNPVGNYSDTGRIRYNVTGITAEGCNVSDDILVTIADEAYVIVPSAFSPNGDGLNDVIRVLGVGYVSLNSFRIFNRWGEQVFNTKQMSEGWDGTLRGQKQPIGSYYWVISATNLDNTTRSFRGDITLIR